jgi:membrane glycosyltransferase
MFPVFWIVYITLVILFVMKIIEVAVVWAKRNILNCMSCCYWIRMI